MASGSNTIEGIADGVVPSAANSGGVSGDALSSIAVASGDAITAKTSAADHGSRGVEMSFLAGGAGATRILWACASSSSRQVVSFYYKIDSLPASAEDLGGMRHASGNMGILTIGSDGKLIMLNAAGTGISASRAPSTFPVAQWVRVEMSVQNGTTTSDGTLGYSYYLGESSTALYTWESSVQNAGTTAQAYFFIGRSTGRAEAHVVQYDTIRWQSLASGWMSPYAAGSSNTIENTAEGGTNGVAPTIANTGGASGTAASAVNVGTGNTIYFSDFMPAHGSKGYMFTYGTSAGGNMFWDIAESGRLVHSFYIFLSDLPAATEYIGYIRHASGNMCIACIGSDGKFIMQNAAGAGISVSRAASTFPINQMVRVEIAVRKGTTTSDGLIEYSYYLGEATTAEATWSSSAQNTGTADVARVAIGRNTTGTEARVICYDTIRAQALTTGWVGPYTTTNVAPVAHLGADVTNIEPFSTVTLSGVGSIDSDGTIENYIFTQVSGSPSVTLTPNGSVCTYTAPGTVAGTTLVFGLTVVDNTDTSSAQDTVTHTVLPVTERAVVGGVEVPIQMDIITSG